MDEFDILMNAPAGAAPSELEAYFEEACGGDAELRERVERLRLAESQVGGFMGESALGQDGEPREGPGSVIGRYLLVEKIGEGGFGEVFRAEQLEPVRREVALKIVKRGMDTAEVVARFEAERQALAVMDHPGIAKVLDAGATGTGRPFFVMELVHGDPVTTFCEEREFTIDERLELFIEICQAVQHAHQKAIIHRDLKPSNVLVTVHDGKPVPKVIDFGVAKALLGDLVADPLVTRQEQFIGTPAYMSPEQAQAGGVDIDTRSDIYSLGVLLYELLVGSPPFDARELIRAGNDEIRRLIREAEPPRPSTRLSGLTNDELAPVATHRRTDPQRLRGQLRGDLDWIVMKALEKDRGRRYDTANGLAMDLRRHLADEPVTAVAPTVAYRLGKYVRRHRASLVTAAAFVALLVAGVVVSAILAIREREARGLAETRELQTIFRLADTPGPEGIARLTDRLRRHPDDPVVAGRLVSTTWLRPRDMPLSDRFFADAAAITRDGRWIATLSELEGIRIVEVETREQLGGALTPRDAPEVVMTDVDFSSDPEQRWLVAMGPRVPELNGVVEVWEWKDAAGVPLEEPRRVGAPCELEEVVLFSRLSPDGRWLLAGGQGDGSLPRQPMLWNLATGEMLLVGDKRCYNDHSGDWSPDGRLIATAGGGRAGRWQVDELQPDGTATQLAGGSHEGPILSIRFDPSGERVVTASLDGTARVWEARTGTPVTGELRHDAGVVYAGFSPDGQLVATASLDGTARLFDAQAGEPVQAPLRHPGGVEDVHFSPDGLLVVTDCDDERLRTWSVSGGELLEERDGKGRGRFTMDGRGILVRSGQDPQDADHQVWPVRSAPALHQVLRHERPENWEQPGKVLWADVHPDTGTPIVASASREDRVRLMNIETHTDLPLLPVPTEARKPVVRFSPRGDALLVATADAGLWVAKATPAGWGDPQPCGSAEEMVMHAEFSPPPGGGDTEAGSPWIVSALLAGRRAEVVDAATGRVLATLPLESECNFASFSADGEWIVTTELNGAVKVWEGWEQGDASGRTVAEWEASRGCFARFHPANRNLVLYYGVTDLVARIRDIAAGRDIREFAHAAAIQYAEWSPDGEVIVCACLDGTAQVYAATGEPVGTRMRHERAIRGARFSPDGRRIVTASLDGTARVWDAATGYPLCDALKHGLPVNFAMFTPRGNQVVTAGDDATVRIWDLPPVPDGPVPAWVPGWMEAVCGHRLDDDGRLVSVTWDEREKARKAALGRADDNYYAVIAKWFYANPETRPITPFSQVSG